LRLVAWVGEGRLGWVGGFDWESSLGWEAVWIK